MSFYHHSRVRENLENALKSSLSKTVEAAEDYFLRSDEFRVAIFAEAMSTEAFYAGKEWHDVEYKPEYDDGVLRNIKAAIFSLFTLLISPPINVSLHRDFDYGH